MSFMQPEVYRGGYYEIETRNGTEIIPAWLVGTDPTIVDFRDYLESEPDEEQEIIERVGWLHRLQAPGYLDATPWGVERTERGAYASLLEMYGTPDDGPREGWEAEAEEIAEGR